MTVSRTPLKQCHLQKSVADFCAVVHLMAKKEDGSFAAP